MRNSAEPLDHRPHLSSLPQQAGTCLSHRTCLFCLELAPSCVPPHWRPRAPGHLPQPHPLQNPWVPLRWALSPVGSVSEVPLQLRVSCAQDSVFPAFYCSGLLTGRLSQPGPCHLLPRPFSSPHQAPRCSLLHVPGWLCFCCGAVSLGIPAEFLPVPQLSPWCLAESFPSSSCAPFRS